MRNEAPVVCGSSQFSRAYAKKFCTSAPPPVINSTVVKLHHPILFALFAVLPVAAQETTSPSTTDPIHVNMFVGSVVPAGERYVPLTGEQRFKLYLRQTYINPGAYFRAFGAAAGGQASNEPPQWGQGGEAYMKRVGNRFARFTIQDSIEAAGAAALGHEVRYVRCNCTGFLPRAGYALAMNFVTYDRQGKRVPHYSRVGAAFASGFIGHTWMPPGYETKRDVLSGAAMQLSFGTMFNVIREFTPEIKRAFRRK